MYCPQPTLSSVHDEEKTASIAVLGTFVPLGRLRLCIALHREEEYTFLAAVSWCAGGTANWPTVKPLTGMADLTLSHQYVEFSNARPQQRDLNNCRMLDASDCCLQEDANKKA